MTARRDGDVTGRIYASKVAQVRTIGCRSRCRTVMTDWGQTVDYLPTM